MENYIAEKVGEEGFFISSIKGHILIISKEVNELRFIEITHQNGHIYEVTIHHKSNEVTYILTYITRLDLEVDKNLITKPVIENIFRRLMRYDDQIERPDYKRYYELSRWFSNLRIC